MVCVKFGEDRLRIVVAIVCDVSHTDLRMEKPPCAPDLIIYHFFAILANVVDNNNNSQDDRWSAPRFQASVLMWRSEGTDWHAYEAQNGQHAIMLLTTLCGVPWSRLIFRPSRSLQNCSGQIANDPSD